MDVLSCLWAFVVLLSGLGSLTASTKCSFSKDIFGVQIENWDNIRSSKFYLNAPSSTTFIDSLDVPRNWNLAYIGRRLRTYFLAPETGSYIFYLACDDFCELKLSADEKLENLVTLINIKSYTDYMEWNSLNSKEVRLSKGHSYLLEAILAQVGGAYHITVGVKLPDGNYSRPVSNEFLVKYAPPGSFGEAPIGEWGSWSQCSMTCGVGTQSRNRSYCPNAPPVYRQRNTTDLEMRVCQPMRPCSVPLSNIQVRNTSSTSLLVKWKFEWPHELLSFKITYKKTDNETAQIITANSLHESVEIRGLAMYTQYCIRVQLVTLGGVGGESPCVFAMTDEDVPCNSPTKLVARNHWRPNKIRLIWQPLTKSCWRGIPKGYSVRLKVKETAHVDNQTWSRNFSVGPLSTGILIEGLQTYTSYSLQVAALTDKGPGPYSEAIHVETCRCPKRFFVNWMQAPPLCFKNNHTNGTRPAGILPERLPDMLTHACGTCHGHKRTAIIFKEEMLSVDNITSSLGAHTQLNLPVNMAPHIPFAREEWVFLPVVEVAGIAVLMKKPSPGVYAGQLGSSVLHRWPVFLIMFVMYCAFGLAVWSVENYKNSAQFSPRFTRGWSQGLWWAIVSMATVGYGDHYPISVPGRLLAIISVLVGIVMNALFVATMTSSISVFVADEAANPERGSKIGVVSGSVEHPLGMRMNGSKGVTSVSHTTTDALLEGLKSRALDGALIDVLTADPFMKDLNDSNFEVAKIIPNKFYYGIILTGDARILVRHFEEYLKSISIESLSRQPQLTVQEKKESPPQETKPTKSTKEEVIPFFEPGNALFQKTIKATGIALLVCMIIGLVYHVIRVKLRCKRDEPRYPRQKLAAIKAEIRELLDEFHNRIHQRYYALRIKHKQQLLQFKQMKGTDDLVTETCTQKPFTREQCVA